METNDPIVHYAGLHITQFLLVTWLLTWCPWLKILLWSFWVPLKISFFGWTRPVLIRSFVLVLTSSDLWCNFPQLIECGQWVPSSLSYLICIRNFLLNCVFTLLFPLWRFLGCLFSFLTFSFSLSFFLFWISHLFIPDGLTDSILKLVVVAMMIFCCLDLALSDHMRMS